jgi:phage tail-like protein
MTDEDAAYGVALQFKVQIDGKDVGMFSQCEGINAEYEVEEIKEGGNNDFIHRLPGRVKYQNLKLTRALDKDSSKLADLFSSFSTKDKKLHTAHITACDGWQRPVASWSFTGVWPVKYTGPQLNAGTSGTANESLELAHSGFTFEQEI